MTGPAIGMLMNRDAWNKMTPDQKKVHLKASSRISAELALGQFVIENEQILNEIKQSKGVQVVPVTNKAEWEAVTAKYDAAQREKNVADAKKFGVADPAAVIDAYAKARTKWAAMSKGIGRDIDKFADAIWNEVYSEGRPGEAVARTRSDRVMERMLNWLEAPIRLMLWASLLAGFLMMMHVTVDAAGRTLFNHPFAGTTEIVSAYYMVAVAYLPWAWIARNDQHIVAEHVHPSRPKIVPLLARHRREGGDADLHSPSSPGRPICARRSRPRLGEVWGAGEPVHPGLAEPLAAAARGRIHDRYTSSCASFATSAAKSSG